jgi:hypothetical protein
VACAEVITPETINRKISIDHKPGNIGISFNGENVFFTNIE